MKKPILFLLLLVPSVALLYFGLSRDPRLLPSVLIAKEAPDFELTSLEGEKVRLADLRGKPVLLNFWSTWCSTCVGEHHLIREAVQKYAASGIQFYSVLYEDTPEAAKRFLSRYGEGAPILLDPGLRTAIDYGVSGVPETFFIDREGKIAKKHVGMLTPPVLYPGLQTLMGSKN